MAARARSAAVLGAAASTGAIAAAYLAALARPTPPAWAAWAVAVGIAGLLASLLVLGAVHPRRPLGWLGLVFALVFVLFAGGFGLVLAWAPPVDPAMPLWLGLPPPAAIVLYGIGVTPLLVLPLAYARTFDARTLSDDDLARIRAARAARPADGDSGGADASGGEP